MTNNKKNIEQIYAQYAQVPPSAIDLEEIIIGSLIIEKDAIINVIDILKVDAFYDQKHQLIYKAIYNLYNDYKPIDLLTVTEQLRQSNDLEKVGGAYSISQLTNRVTSATNIRYHAQIVVQYFIQRELIRLSDEIQVQSFDPATDVNDLLEYAEKGIFDISTGNFQKQITNSEKLLSDCLKKIEKNQKSVDDFTGVPSGFTAIDRITKGWQPMDLVIIAARPSMGKTALVISMMLRACLNFQKNILIFSLEMSENQIMDRMIIHETGMSANRLNDKNVTADDWKNINDRIYNLSVNTKNIFIDDTPSISILELRTKARRQKMTLKGKLDLIIVDYLQLMTVNTNGMKMIREQEISTITRGLKSLAKELNVPVIALSQLNRSVESRTGDKRPQLSDLRESGAIEQDADMVLFINRPERYNILEDENGNSTKGLAEIIIAKHRNGATGNVNLRFQDDIIRFDDYESVPKFEINQSNDPFINGEIQPNNEF